MVVLLSEMSNRSVIHCAYDIKYINFKTNEISFSVSVASRKTSDADSPLVAGVGAGVIGADGISLGSGSSVAEHVEANGEEFNQFNASLGT